MDFYECFKRRSIYLGLTDKMPNFAKNILFRVFMKTNLFATLLLLVVAFTFAGCHKKKTIYDYDQIVKEDGERLWRDGLDADLHDSTTDINDPRNYGEFSSGSYTYDKQENRILERRNEKYDIRLLPYYDPLHKILGYQFQFFNYGGNVIVDKKYRRNVFLSSITFGYTLQFIALSESQTSERWDNKEYDSIYGTFAKATILTTLGQNPQTGLYDNREWNNVLVTPLSYKFLTGSKENNDGGVILVHFVGNKMNGAMEDLVLFYADIATWQIVHDAPNTIIYQPTF